MMMKPTDEQISAYLDGEMQEADVAAFEAALESDSALQAALERYLAQDEALKAAFPETELPEGYAARMGLGPVDEEAAPATVTSMADFRERKSMLQRLRWPVLGAMAASIAAALMVVSPWQSSAPEGLAGSAAFQTAMTTARATETQKLEDGRTASPILTFKDGDGRFCREFSVAGPQDGVAGIACREGRAWQVEAEVKTGPQQGAEPGFQMAAGADTQPLDAAYARLKATDPLAADVEKAAIAGGWK